MVTRAQTASTRSRRSASAGGPALLVAGAALSLLLASCSGSVVVTPDPAGAGAGGSSPREGGSGAAAGAGDSPAEAGSGAASSGGAAGGRDAGTTDAGAAGGGTGGAGGAAVGSGGSGGSGADGGVGGRAAGGAAGAPADAGACVAVETAEALEGAGHTSAACDPVTYVSNPPSSGTHYPVWTEFKTYDTPVPEGFWVHSLEHGAVVISYSCPGGCASEVAAAQAMIDALPVDPLCYPTGGTSFRRIVMTPDPHLTTRFAASAWGFTLRATCFDPAPFRAFIDAHYAHTSEDFCSAGGYRPGDYPATCGQ